MAAGPGFYDAEGIWQYGESTPAGPLFSDYLNLLADSASDAIALDRVHLASLDNGPLIRRQLDTTNSYPRMKFQTGMGRITGAAALQINEAVTFPVAFSTVPVVLMSFLGVAVAGAFNPSATVFTANVSATPATPTTTGFSANLSRAATNLAGPNEYYYSWLAIGAA